ncbi:hypothetical protein [Neomoorella humiferrea]|uniref:hypothetical protein n=1 Tax=Neomoorella humiferrea TaxID=676965 RepID=UPI0030CB430A
MSFYGAEDPWLDPTRWWLQDRGIEVVGLDILTLLQRGRGFAGRGYWGTAVRD